MGCGAAVQPAQLGPSDDEVTKQAPEWRSEATARQKAVASLHRRRTAIAPSHRKQLGLQGLSRALRILDEGRPHGLEDPQSALEAFLSMEGQDLGLGAMEQMRTALKLVGQTLQGSGTLLQENGTASAACPSLPQEAFDLIAERSKAWHRFGQWCLENLLAEAFELVDNDSDAKLSAGELMVLLMLVSVQKGPADHCVQTGTLLTPGDAEQIVREFDIECDGRLNEWEFLSMVHHLEREILDSASIAEAAPLEKALPHLVLYFDVNNTCLMGDTLTGASAEHAFATQLASSAWGIKSQSMEGALSWVLVCPEPSATPPWDGLITYTEFVVQLHPMPESGSKEDVGAVKKMRREKLERFCDLGQPGEALHGHLDRLLTTWKHPAGDGAHHEPGLLPSFYYLLRKLKGAGRSFNVVFRTFGVDIDERIVAEFNAFCSGCHPLFSDGEVMDGSDGDLDHRIDLQDASSVGTFYRNGDDIVLVWGTHEQPPAGEGLEFFQRIESTRLHQGAACAAKALEERILQRSETVVLRDFYPGWSKANFAGRGGKPIFLRIEDAALLPIFFDDHIRPVDPSIVDAMDAREFPRRLPMAQVFDIHLVKALPVWSISETSYFWDHLCRCEKAKEQQLLLHQKVAHILHDARAVRRVIDLLKGSMDGVCRKAHNLLKEDVKFTPWTSLAWVQHGSPEFDEEEEAHVRLPTKTLQMRWPTSPQALAEQPMEPGSDQVDQVGPTTSQGVARPLCAEGVPASAREAFLQGEWSPFCAEMAQHLAATRHRASQGFSLPEVVPPQPVIHDLAQRCAELTARWHGRANMSAVYEFLMDVAELDGNSPYKFSDLTPEQSPDGYVRVLDGQKRRQTYSAPAAAGQAQRREGAAYIGGMKQSTGESPIDNLVLPLLVKKREALLLRVGHRIQQFLLRAVQRKQRRLLKERGLEPETDPEEVIRVLGPAAELQPESVSENSESPKEALSLQVLRKTGMILSSYGQLPEDARAEIETWLAKELPQDGGDDFVTSELASFLAHCHQHPGRAYEGSAVQHKLMLFRSIASPDLRLLRRSEVERFTQHRYFAVAWTRAVPLLALQSAPSQEAGQERVLVHRPPGVNEYTRFRKNAFAYGEGHGLGQSGGGCAESPPWLPGTLMYEFGTLLCVDESGKVPNHEVTDIEKLIRDARLLCPPNGLKDALPGEFLHDTGQNPVIASSIGPTAHLQAMRANASDFPLLAERNRPRWAAPLEAWIDIIQVGEQQDAFFVQARSREPDARPLLHYLVALRARLLSSFGRRIDFSTVCTPTLDGEFLVCIAPITCITKISVPKGEGCLGHGLGIDFQNPDTGEKVTQHELPCATVDCSHGKGNILALNQEFWRLALEGRPMLSRLYDFNRKPGARAVVEEFLVDLENSPEIWIRHCVSLRSHGVLGMQQRKDGELCRRAAEPGSDVCIMDPSDCPADSGTVRSWLGLDSHAGQSLPSDVFLALAAPPAAKIHSYSGKHCLHYALNLGSGGGQSASREQARKKLAEAYRVVLAEFASTDLVSIRLCPLGKTLVVQEDFAQLTFEALRDGFSMLEEVQQQRLNHAREIDLCIASEPDLALFQSAFCTLPGDPPM